MNMNDTRLAAPVAALILAALFCVPAMADVPFVINNLDPAGFGFNDTTPVAPVDGNTGTTLGEQRLIALRFALDLWGSILESDVEVVVQTFFDDELFCDKNNAALAAARPLQYLSDFEAELVPSTWYPIALANTLAGEDLIDGGPDPIPMPPEPNDDLVVRFNELLDSDKRCLKGSRWYYGLAPSPGSDISFVQVALHEISHGLGFSNLLEEATGELDEGIPTIFTRFNYDNLQKLFWDEMTDAQRATSARSCGHVAWGGRGVQQAASAFLDSGFPALKVQAPGYLPGMMFVGPAEFGPPLTSPGVQGQVVLVDDGVNVGNDACEPLTAQSAMAVQGKIALVDRGNCAFTTKVVNAEAAGAVAVLVADIVPTCPPPTLGTVGTAPAIGIPSARISQQDGNLLKQALPGVVVTLGEIEDFLYGADAKDRVLLRADNPLVLNTSIIHWDDFATPDLLMEPFPDYQGGLALGVDLTAYVLRDLGWPLATAMLDSCDTEAPNVSLPGGGTLQDLLDICLESSASEEELKECVFDVGMSLHRLKLLSGEEQSGLFRCVNMP